MPTNGGTADDEPAADTPEWVQAAQLHYDPVEFGELTTAVVYAIADAMDMDPVEVKHPSLYESVDVASLEKTFFGPDVRGDSRQGVGTVEFLYGDHLVTVKSDGWIQVYETTGREEPDE